MSKIIKAYIHNTLGIKDIQIEPEGKSIIVGGANGQGKSSLIKALMMAVGGKRLVPERPVHDGAENSKVDVVIESDEGRFLASLLTDANRKTKLVVRGAEGEKVSSPQEFLDRLFRGVSFDPGAFRNQRPGEQKDTLLKLVGLDMTEIDRHKADLVYERTEIGRELRKAEAQLAGMSVYPGCDEEVSQTEIIEQMDLLRKQAEERKLAESNIALSKSYLEKLNGRLEAIFEEIAKLKKEASDLDSAINEKGWELADLEKRAGSMPAPTRAEYDTLKAKLEGAQEHNKCVVANKARSGKKTEVEELQLQHLGLEQELAKLDAEKFVIVSRATFPVDGLGFDEDGVTYQGRPLAQASEAEQWRVSLAIGFALNPDGVLFMPTTGGLDKKSRAKLIEQAEELGVQLILEVIDEPDDVSVVVEAGRIKE